VALMKKIHATQTWKDAMARNNWIDLFMTGPEYEAFLKKEATRVEAVLRTIGLVQ
jgi:putative tricarboxylic transport membrane protein